MGQVSGWQLLIYVVEDKGHGDINERKNKVDMCILPSFVEANVEDA